MNFPDKEPDEIHPEQSCALDVANLGGTSLEDVARVLNMTRERARQIQDTALGKLALLPGDLPQFVDDPSSQRKRIQTQPSSFGRGSSESEEDEKKEEDEEDTFFGSVIDFLSFHPKADEVISKRIWRIYKQKTDERHNPDHADDSIPDE